MMGSDMVVAVSSDTFARDELLVEHLAGCVAGFSPTLACFFNSCLVSGPEVVITGIFECTLITTEVL